MNFDDWRSTEPDEPWARSEPCETPGCENSITFPTFESFCTNCLAKQARQREDLQRQSELLDVQVRR